jgi:hypothetical protein
MSKRPRNVKRSLTKRKSWERRALNLVKITRPSVDGSTYKPLNIKTNARANVDGVGVSPLADYGKAMPTYAPNSERVQQLASQHVHTGRVLYDCELLDAPWCDSRHTEHMTTKLSK